MPFKDDAARAKYQREYRQKHKRRLNAYLREWHGSPAGLVSQAKKRAKELGVPFGIVPDDVKIPARCPVLGIRLARGTKQSCDASPTVDQIEPRKGYVKGNVQVMSALANRMKSNAAPRDLRRFAEWISRTYGQ